jgi:hypothetical protein
MLKYTLNTKNEPLAIDLEVAVKKPCRVRVVVYNPEKPSTVYFDRFKDVVDKAPFEIRMPQNAKVTKMEVFCSQPNSSPDNIRVTKLQKKALKRHAPCLNGNGWNQARVKEFLKFAKEFCENASIYDYGTYYSDKGNFRIDYYPVIKHNGRPISTVARIHNESGRMEVAKGQFVKMTVPSRVATLLHEFSHFNLNEDQHDETEADLNALKIYLGDGYPVIEAHKGFLEIFKSHPSDQNRGRYEYIKNFIDNFDSDKYKMCLP